MLYVERSKYRQLDLGSVRDINGLQQDSCPICGEPIVSAGTVEPHDCAVCHRAAKISNKCATGHYVCNVCLGKTASDYIVESCLTSPMRDPMELINQLMWRPEVRLFGPEHFTLVAAPLLTAYHNCGGKIDLPQALEQVRQQASQLPDRTCLESDFCGAVMGVRAYVSIAAAMTGRNEGLAEKAKDAVVKELRDVGEHSCCKRGSLLAAEVAVRFTHHHLGVSIETHDGVICGFSVFNPDCPGQSCPYHPRHSLIRR